MPLRTDRVKTIKKKKELTNRAIGGLIGVNENTVGRWINGTRQPGSLNLAELAEALETSVDFLLGNTDDPTPPPRTKVSVTDMELRLLQSFRKNDKDDIRRLIGDDD